MNYLHQQYQYLFNELNHKTGYLGDDLDITDYKLPNQIIDQFRRTIKMEWLSALKVEEDKGNHG